MPASKLFLLMPLGLFVSVLNLGAAEPEALPIGSRIRAVASDVPGLAPTITGTLVARDGESFTLHVKGSANDVVLRRSAVNSLYVSRGHGRAKAAGIGALVGAAFGFGLGVVPGEEKCNGSGCLTFGAIVALPLAALGSAVGAAIAPERWEAVPPDQAHVGLRSARPRPFGVFVSVAF
jgi:hypothetical protein